MKKHRKQIVNVDGQKRLMDVPVDGELYKADNRSEYQRARGKAKHVSLDSVLLIDESANIIECYEEAQLLIRLREALSTLDKKERQLIGYLYYDGFTEREAASILGISQQAVGKQKRRIIAKLRNNLIDWL